MAQVRTVWLGTFRVRPAGPLVGSLRLLRRVGPSHLDEWNTQALAGGQLEDRAASSGEGRVPRWRVVPSHRVHLLVENVVDHLDRINELRLQGR